MNENEILSKIESAPEGELKELKLWLFRENIRLRNERMELQEMCDSLEEERLQQMRDQRAYLEHLSLERQQIRHDEQLIAEKLEVLKRGFDELDADRRQLKAKEAELNAKEIALDTKLKYSYTVDDPEVADVLFKGVTSYLALKKRYKDLMKIYHPDSLGGDTEMVFAINRVYDKLRTEYENEKVAW